MAKVMVMRFQLCNLLGTIFPSGCLSFLGDKQKPCTIKGHEVMLYPLRFVKREEKPMQREKIIIQSKPRNIFPLQGFYTLNG